MRRREDERPVGYQIAGSDPATLARAARILEDHGADLVDCNMGCPARKIVRRRGGSALMRDPDHAARLVATLARAVSIPVTVKMRSGWDSLERNAVALAQRLRDAGAAAVTIHARTRADGHEGPADWNLLAEAAKSVGLLVIGCGGIATAADAVRLLRETGCQGVMIARAALGNPWIFEEVRAAIEDRPRPTIPLAARWRDVRAHLEETVAWGGEALAVRLWRRYGAWYVAGRPGALSARERICRATSRLEVEALLRPFFAVPAPSAAG